MNLKPSSRKQFAAMFCQTMKLTSIMAILAFLCFMFFTSFYYDTYEPDYYRATAHFFDDLRWSGVENFANIAFLGAGVLNAMICFSFAWSKKQSNVVLSLGMKKSDIYFAKMLGGIVPMGVSVMLAGVIETLANISGRYIVDKRFFAMAAFVMLQYLAVYVLAFALSSAVMANVGNVIEGAVFTVILAIFPTLFKGFLTHTFWQFTHGAYIVPRSEIYAPGWNWSNPFIVFSDINSTFMSAYFEHGSTVLPSVVNWSGIIMAGIYAVAIILLGYVGFNKRRNEICGTWGRAKAMNEITGAVTGFYALFFIGFYTVTSDHGQANVLTYVFCCGAFLPAYIVFKLVFGYKRKKEFKSSINRFPIYAMGFAAVFMVFSMGLFGYSSKVPEAAEIKSVKVSSPYYKLFDTYFSGSSEFALKLTTKGLSNWPDPDGTMYYGLAETVTAVTFSDYSDIEKITKIHESFVRDGKIKDNGAHSCACDVLITYTLKNGKTISRYYTETTEGTTLKLLTLNDTDTFNKALYNNLNINTNFNYLQSVVTDKNEEGYLDIDEYTEQYGESFPEYDSYEIINDFHSRIEYLAQVPCYIFPTDMCAGYKLGFIDKEFYDAIITDISNMSANRYFNHSAEDELGVLSFGLSSSGYMAWDDGELIVADKYDPNEVSPPDGTINRTSWNVNSADVKGIVVTKDMKNTVEYMKEHDLLKYFERKLDVQDIKSVKLATMGELINGNYEKSEIFPIFYGAFWTSQQMKEWVRENSIHHYYYRLFDHIHNEITDRKQIEKLLNEGVVFGYCASDSKIMEITYNDGSVATVMVRADALK